MSFPYFEFNMRKNTKAFVFVFLRLCDEDDEVWLQSILSPMPLAPRPLSGCHPGPLFAHQEIFTQEILNQEAFTLELFIRKFWFKICTSRKFCFGPLELLNLMKYAPVCKHLTGVQKVIVYIFALMS